MTNREWNYWTFGQDVARAVVLAVGSSGKYVNPSDAVYYEYKGLYLFVRLFNEIVFDNHKGAPSDLLTRFGRWHYDNCFDLCDLCDALDMFDQLAISDAS